MQIVDTSLVAPEYVGRRQGQEPSNRVFPSTRIASSQLMRTNPCRVTPVCTAYVEGAPGEGRGPSARTENL